MCLHFYVQKSDAVLIDCTLSCSHRASNNSYVCEGKLWKTIESVDYVLLAALSSL